MTLTFWQMYAGIALCVALLVSVAVESESHWTRFALSAAIGMLWLPILVLLTLE